jgi:transcriptional regulator
MPVPKNGSPPKCDRVLALHEQGVDNDAIADRLGVSRREISALIKYGRARREKAQVASGS